MKTINLTLPDGEVVVNGKQISFIAPCDCSVTKCLRVNEVDYAIVDATGCVVTEKGGAWAANSMVSVILDTVNKKAYLQGSSLGAITQKLLATIPASGWSATPTNGWLTNQVSVSGMLSSYEPALDLRVTSAALAEAEREALGLIMEVETFDGYVIARALEAPKIDLNVRFMGV